THSHRKSQRRVTDELRPLGGRRRLQVERLKIYRACARVGVAVPGADHTRMIRVRIGGPRRKPHEVPEWAKIIGLLGSPREWPPRGRESKNEYLRSRIGTAAGEKIS